MSARCHIDVVSKRPWVWYRRLDRRNGYLAWGPVSAPFDRSRPLHWAVVLYVLLRDGKRYQRGER